MNPIKPISGLYLKYSLKKITLHKMNRRNFEGTFKSQLLKILKALRTGARF